MHPVCLSSCNTSEKGCTAAEYDGAVCSCKRATTVGSDGFDKTVCTGLFDERNLEAPCMHWTYSVAKQKGCSASGRRPRGCFKVGPVKTIAITHTASCAEKLPVQSTFHSKEKLNVLDPPNPDLQESL